MDERHRTVVSWSSGKDSAWALHEVRRGRPDLEIVGLVTTLTERFGRVSMHGVRESVLAAQARALGLPTWPVRLPYPCPNAEYERRMEELVTRLRAEGIDRIVFGDLFLEDVRRYREERLAGTGLEPVFPLWGRPTRRLAEEMIEGGLRTVLVAVDPRKLPARFAGRWFDRSLLDELPDDVDPCGERGEFHSCVVAGPMLREPLPILPPGPVVERDGFVFCDVRLETDPPSAEPFTPGGR